MIEIVNTNNKTWEDEILARLKAYNRKKCTWLREQGNQSTNAVNFFAIEDNNLYGGAVGHVEYGWYMLDLLLVDESCRGKNVGTSLLQRIEDYTKKSNLVGIRLETWDFQARGFYEKQGFVVFGELNDCPPGATVYFMKKQTNLA